MVDKNYCMSSYLALRYIADKEKDFFSGMTHENTRLFADDERILVRTADEIDEEIKKVFSRLEGKK